MLKLLQKAYFGKVKMIFIDPPYNTGGEFIYSDKYAETLDTYLAYTGQIDDEGRKFSTNTDAAGRFHSNWLSMIYPRLYLARSLLREDGVIFIAIDDHEVSRLRELCDQIFGEENLVAQIVWQHSVQPKGYTDIFSVHHNHILCYSKSDAFRVSPLERTEKDNKAYSNPDDDPKGPWRSGDVRNALFRPNLIYQLETPSGKLIDPPENGWRWSKETMAAKIASGEVRFSEDETKITRKIYLSDQDGRAPETIWFAEDVGGTRDGSAELKALFDGKAPFDTVKPTKLIDRMMQISGFKADDICLDFFAGSDSTAVATYEHHPEGKFIVVQLPEAVEASKPHGKLALEFGLDTVSKIARERIKRFVHAKTEEQKSSLLEPHENIDLGFRCFTLAKSAFRVWNGTEAEITKELDLHVQNVDPSATPEDIVYELLLKAGFPLTTKVKAAEMAGKTVYSVEDGALLICLDKEITSDLIDALADADPLQVICLDEGFKGNDQLKANAVQTFKARAASRETEIVFRTV